LKNIVIVDDHLLFAQGLKMVIEKVPNYKVVSIIDDIDLVLKSIANLKPNIILLDVNLNGKNSKSICESISFQFPEILVIVISMHHEFTIIREMKLAGAKGYLLKNSNQDQIYKAIEIVSNGGKYFEDEVGQILNKGATSGEFSLEQLNSREKKILKLILLDKTNKKIAEELSLSIKTIEFYRNSLYIKLNVKNIIQLVQKMQKLKYWDEE
jgi:two-component system, NarL family, response regulator NreC